MSDYWYENYHKLQPEMCFRCEEWYGGFIKLDRRVPGDGTKWYVADWSNGWAYYDNTIEPGDLLEEVKETDVTGNSETTT